MRVVNSKNKVVLSTHEGSSPMQGKIKVTPANREEKKHGHIQPLRCYGHMSSMYENS